MVPQLQDQLAAEHQKELRRTADLYRLAAEAAPPAALRQRIGRRLISIGLRISGARETSVTQAICS